MKILIEGKPATGKSIYARYLAYKFKIPLFDFDQIMDIKEFTECVLNNDIGIFVIQDRRFLKQDFKFTHVYNCIRKYPSSFTVSDGVITQRYPFASLIEFSQPPFDEAPTPELKKAAIFFSGVLLSSCFFLVIYLFNQGLQSLKFIH